jgi:hypothetical protein
METRYIVEVNYRNKSSRTITCKTKEEQKEKFEEYVNHARTDKDIASIFTREESYTGITFDVARISAIISDRFFRPVMIRTLLDADQVSRKLSVVALACYGAFQKFPPNQSDDFIEKVIDFAKNELFDKHSIKV